MYGRCGVPPCFVGFSRKEVKQLFEEGRVRQGRKRLKKGDRLEAGIALTIDAPAEFEIRRGPSASSELVRTIGLPRP